MRRTMIILLFVALAALCLPAVLAAPTGATLTSNITDYGPSRSAAALTHNRSTITTLVLNAIQQDQHWKAYVGNVTGTLTLDDASNQTIYDWTGISIAGEVYATRNSSVTFSSPACADNATIIAEQLVMNMTGADVDSINLTFNATDHTSTFVGATSLSGCRMTSLYVSDASQGQTSSADFQEFLMEDATNSLVYVAIINNDQAGYNDQNYDFQMIVAESHIQAPSTYYFYVELGS